MERKRVVVLDEPSSKMCLKIKSESTVIHQNSEYCSSTFNSLTQKNLTTDLFANERLSPRRFMTNAEDDNSLLYFVNTSRVITDEEIATGNAFELKEISGNLFNNQSLQINASGIINNTKKDGIVLFGSQGPVSDYYERNPRFHRKCDIYCNLEKSIGFGFPYLFIIFYKREDRRFYIKDYHEKGLQNKLLFIKIDSKKRFYVQKKEMISVGNFIFQLSPLPGEKIEIKNVTKNGISQTKFIYNKNKKSITLGRDSENDIPYPQEKGLSRVQVTFSYDEEKKSWYVSDGNGKKESMNGTWQIAVRPVEIYDGMIFEIFGSRIQCQFFSKTN